MKKPEPYTFIISPNALGVQHVFKGPGMPLYASGVHFMQVMNDWATKCIVKRATPDNDPYDPVPSQENYEAETVIRLLNSAFRAGQEHAKAEIRQVLGVP